MALKGIGLNGKAEIHMRKLKMWLLGLAAAAMLSVSACAQEIPEGSLNGNGSVRAPTAPYTANVRTIMAAITITSRVVNLFFSVVVFIKKLLSKNRSVGFTRMS